jgi:hypothetical protein
MIDRYNRAQVIAAEESSGPFDAILVSASAAGILPVVMPGGDTVLCQVQIGTTILPLAATGFTATGKTGTYVGVYGLNR